MYNWFDVLPFATNNCDLSVEDYKAYIAESLIFKPHASNKVLSEDFEFSQLIKLFDNSFPVNIRTEVAPMCRTV